MRLRIIHVIPSIIKGGAERLALNITERLADLGHEVMLLSLRDDNRYPELSSKHVRVANAQVYYSFLGKDMIDISEYESAIDEFQPDIIHSHLIESELVSRHNPRPEIAYITHWHGCPSLTNPTPFWAQFNKEFVWKWNTKRRLIRNYKACNNHFLCITDFIQSYVTENLGVKDSEIEVLHNAIDLNRFRPIKTEKKSGFRLISIGSLQKNKNHRFLLNVVRNLIDEGLNDIHLDIYGEGPEHDFLNAKIKRLGLSDHVKLNGIVSDIEVQLNQADLLVHSAWQEPFGLIFIEAMACGIPVVSFNTGGPSELINDGENGFLIQKDDLEGFCSRIKDFYNNREQLDVIGRNGIQHAKHFGLAEYVKKIEGLYQQRLAIVRK